jgi:hypothetical protein
MSDFFILFISAVLNCLFVYLATNYLSRFLGNSVTKRNAITEGGVRFARAMLILGIWAGSCIYFTFGATALIDLKAPLRVPPEYGWRNAIGIVNGVLPVLVIMLSVKHTERRAKDKLPSLQS